MAKVLIIRLSSLGDVAMLVPVVASVAARYPQDRFTVMTRVAFTPLFKNLSFNVNVISVDVLNKHKGFLGLNRLVAKCISMGFSCVADEHDVLRSKIIRRTLLMLGKRVAHIDKGRKEKKKMLATKQLVPPLTPTYMRYLDVFEKLGFEADIEFKNLFDFVSFDISDFNVYKGEKNCKWVGIAPFAKHKGKVYPAEKMQKVIDMLAQNKNICLFLFGAGKKERRLLDEWASKFNDNNNIINLTGKLNLEKELMFMSFLDTIITMDSANMHLASLVQVPVVSIWGATDPALGFYGFGQDINNAICANIDCHPCSVYGNKPCLRKDYACMQTISEESIVDKVNEILSKTAE